MRKMRMMMALLLLVAAAACDKGKNSRVMSEQSTNTERTAVSCGREVIAKVPLKAGETGIWLPIGTKICIAQDETTVSVLLPDGYTFLANAPGGKTLPVPFSTYTCECARSGSFCKVFFAEGLGFGCLQYSCSGSCTGKFTYMGYSVDKVLPTTDKELFLSDVDVQMQIRKNYRDILNTQESMAGRGEPVYVKQEVAGVSYYLLMDRSSIAASVPEAMILPPRAVCECEGTKECKLRTVSLRATSPDEKAIDIYFCDGRCNGCELTVD